MLFLQGSQPRRDEAIRLSLAVDFGREHINEHSKAARFAQMMGADIRVESRPIWPQWAVETQASTPAFWPIFSTCHLDGIEKTCVHDVVGFNWIEAFATILVPAWRHCTSLPDLTLSFLPMSITVMTSRRNPGGSSFMATHVAIFHQRLSPLKDAVRKIRNCLGQVYCGELGNDSGVNRW